MIEIHPISEKHLPFVHRLEKRLFPDPWSEKALRDYLLSPHARGYILLEDGEACCYGLFQSILGEGEVLRIGTAPDRVRRGYAEKILSHYFDTAEKENVKTIFLEVRSQNLAARKLYEKHGFVLTGTRKRYYRDPAEDAFLYQKNWNGRKTV